MYLIATVTTEEQTLRTTVRTMLVATLAAGLRGMPGVYFDDLDTLFLSFVGEEPMELGKAPRVKSALPLCMSQLGSLTDVGQILKDNRTAWGSMLHNAFRKHVVVIFALPKQFATQLLKMSLSRFGAFGLQFSTKTEDAAFLLFPLSLSQEMLIRGDCWPIQAQVYPNNLLRGNASRFRDGNGDMQAPLPLARAQDSTTHLPPNALLCIGRNK